MLALAPNSMSMGSENSRKTTVKTRPDSRVPQAQFPRMRSASSWSPRPIIMAARGAPPIPVRAAKAEMTVISGKQTPMPVRARDPTSGI